jgi:hypothetical protein
MSSGALLAARRRGSAGSGSLFAGAHGRWWPICSEIVLRESARWLRRSLPPDYLCRAATRSDEWLAYEAAFPRRTHRLCAKASGETSHAERFFCTARQRVSRLVRKTLSFSKRFDMHELWLRIFLPHYNLQYQR